MSEQTGKQERLQKAMARLGIASRRQAETLITEGLVRVNGHVVTELGTKVKATDLIEVQGRKGSLANQNRQVYYLLHKPVGVITSVRDPQQRKTVLDILRERVQERVYPVGRLDYDTSGLLLLTNDGDLTYRLTHPSYGVNKTYLAMVQGVISTQALSILRTGVRLEDGPTSPAIIQRVEEIKKGNIFTLVELTIHEGRNRQVRRMFEAVGYPLTSLQRIAFGPLVLDEKMKPGEFRPLRKQEIDSLKKEVGLL